MKYYLQYLWVAAAVAAWGGVPAQANTITGEIWENFTTTTLGNEQGTFANVATLSGARSADVTFSLTGPINFSSVVGGYTIGGFLGSGGATIVTGSGQAGNNLDNTLFYFSGMLSMVHGETYDLSHDDGAELSINGSDVVNSSIATDSFYTWTGASGNYNFQLAYAEVEGPPGILTMHSVPDGGSTMAMLGGVLTVMGGVARRIRK